MYRFVLLACLISSAQPQCQQKNWAWTSNYEQQSGNTWVKNFESSAFDIAQDIIKIDRNIQSFCNSYANHDIKEIYGMEFYQLSVQIPDFSESNIVVKVMHRMLLVSAEDCTRMYADVKLLPDVVDPKRAVWKYWQGQLFIRVPYKASPQQNKCREPIDLSVVLVPQHTAGNCVASCSRQSYGDGIIRDNVWHPSGTGYGQQGGMGQGSYNNGYSRGVAHNGVFGSRN